MKPSHNLCAFFAALSPAVSQGCHAAFHQLQPEAQELLRNLQKTGRHRSEEVLRETLGTSLFWEDWDIIGIQL